MPNVGPYRLHAIEAGRLRLDGGAMFGVVPKAVWQRQVAADSRNRIDIRLRCLLLETSNRLILVDTGVGHKESSWFEDAFAVDHSHNDLYGSLARAGFSPEDVTDVILTHLHFDHAGGSTVRQEGRVVPTFINAAYHIQQDHWATACAPSVREAASFKGDNFLPLQRTGQLNLVHGAGELFPGLGLYVIYGHTQAQQLVRMTGPEGTLVFVADLLPLTQHVKGPWVMAYDTQPALTMMEKQRFLKEAHEEGYHLFFEHDPGTVIANVGRNERGFFLADSRPLADLF